MEKNRAPSFRPRAIPLLLGFLASAGHAQTLPPGQLPTGGQVVAGQAGLSTSGSRLDINQTSPRAVINWNSFNVGAQAQVNFNQPNPAAVVLNRVTAPGPSAIFGKLTANGQVFLINPSGILFGPGASVNVGGLVASTLSIADADFMAGVNRFSQAGTLGNIVNQGSLNASQGGYIALVASEIRNEGTIAVPLGKVALAAGGEVAVDIQNEQLLNVTISPAAVRALVENKGLVMADGGLVLLGAKAADRLLGSVINNSGVIEAKGLSSRSGQIVLHGGDNVSVIQGGSLDASGPGGGAINIAAYRIANDGSLAANSTQGAGGQISLNFSDNLTTGPGAQLSAAGTAGGKIAVNGGGAQVTLAGRYDASGSEGLGGTIQILGRDIILGGVQASVAGNGGGRILVGGDESRGNTVGIPYASTVRVEAATSLNANAIQRGNGGTIAVWSNNDTRFGGTASANPAGGGAPGKIDIASRNLLSAQTSQTSVINQVNNVLPPLNTYGIAPQPGTPLLAPNPANPVNPPLAWPTMGAPLAPPPQQPNVMVGASPGVAPLLVANRPPQPDPMQPGPMQPGPNQPGLNQPGPNRPDGNQPGPNQAGLNQPAQRQPDQNQPDQYQPGQNRLEPRQPGQNPADQEHFGQNQPSPDQPVRNQPGQDQPYPNQPAQKQAALDQPGPERVNQPIQNRQGIDRKVQDQKPQDQKIQNQKGPDQKDPKAQDQPGARQNQPNKGEGKAEGKAEGKEGKAESKGEGKGDTKGEGRGKGEVTAEHAGKLANAAAAQVARHAARTETYKEALDTIRHNPKAADLPECGAGGGDVCIPVAAPAAKTAAAAANRLIQVGALPPTPIRRKVAYLIGNNDYKGAIPLLETPIADVEAVGKLLQKNMDYEVNILRNATKADIILTLKKIAEQTSRDESVVIMYAGHGYQMDDTKQGFWIPVDGTNSSPKNWVSNSDIGKFLSIIPAKQIILISDSCFSGTLTKEEKVKGRSGIKREQLLSRRSVIVMSSGGEEPVSDEGKEGHSIFAHALIKQLESVKGFTTSTQIFEQVKADVTSEFPQEPQLGAVISAGHAKGGDFMIISK